MIFIIFVTKAAKLDDYCLNDQQCVLGGKYTYCKYIIPRIYGKCRCPAEFVVTEDNKCLPSKTSSDYRDFFMFQNIDEQISERDANRIKSANLFIQILTANHRRDKFQTFLQTKNQYVPARMVLRFPKIRISVNQSSRQQVVLYFVTV